MPNCKWCERPTEGELCAECQAEDKAEKEKVEALIQAGHPYHCAMRQVSGDGLCECALYAQGYAPDKWLGPLRAQED